MKNIFRINNIFVTFIYYNSGHLERRGQADDAEPDLRLDGGPHPLLLRQTVQLQVRGLEGEGLVLIMWR